MRKEDIRITEAVINLSGNKDDDLYNVKNFVSLVNENKHLDLDLVYQINKLSGKSASYIEEILNFIYLKSSGCKIILQLDDYDFPKPLLKVFAIISEYILVPIVENDIDILYNSYTYLNSFKSNCQFFFNLNDDTVIDLSSANNFMHSMKKDFSLIIDVFKKESSILKLIEVLDEIDVLYISNPLFLQPFLCPDPAKNIMLLPNGRVINNNVHENDEYYLAEFKDSSYDFSMFSKNYSHNVEMYYDRVNKLKCSECSCVKFCKNGLYDTTPEQERIFCSTNEILNNFFKEKNDEKNN